MAHTILPTILINNIYTERVAVTRMDNGINRMIFRITYPLLSLFIFIFIHSTINIVP